MGLVGDNHYCVVVNFPWLLRKNYEEKISTPKQSSLLIQRCLPKVGRLGSIPTSFTPGRLSFKFNFYKIANIII